MADKTCVYYETFETLYDELPTLKLKNMFHKAILGRGLHGTPFPKIGDQTYWDGRITEAFRYAEALFSANEKKRAAGAKGGASRRKKAQNEDNTECLKHTSSNVNVNVNVNDNDNDNNNNTDITSPDMVPIDMDQSVDDKEDKYEWE